MVRLYENINFQMFFKDKKGLFVFTIFKKKNGVDKMYNETKFWFGFFFFFLIYETQIFFKEPLTP